MPEFTLKRNLRGLLILERDGQVFEGVEPVRAFPLSDPRHFVSIVDSSGREQLFIESLDGLDPQQHELLEAELAQREFVPEIRRVLNQPGESEPATWQVETDRGITTFEVESEDSVHRRDSHRVSIVDSHGIRYEIPDVRRLDAHSKRVLDRFL